jgi:hypothetical protein
MSSSCKRSSCGLGIRSTTLQAPFEELAQAVSIYFLILVRLVGANDADFVDAVAAVQTGIAFGLGQRPESHGKSL